MREVEGFGVRQLAAAFKSGGKPLHSNSASAQNNVIDMTEEMKLEVSRRSFIRETGAAFSGAALAGVSSAAAVPGPVTLTLLDPTGAQEITHLFAARLPDLNGKVIAELAVDPTKWQPHRTMPYIEELLKKQFPSIRFIPMQEFPMGLQISEDRVIKMVAARKPDAVIIGNAG